VLAQPEQQQLVWQQPHPQQQQQLLRRRVSFAEGEAECPQQQPQQQQQQQQRRLSFDAGLTAAAGAGMLQGCNGAVGQPQQQPQPSPTPVNGKVQQQLADAPQQQPAVAACNGSNTAAPAAPPAAAAAAGAPPLQEKIKEKPCKWIYVLDTCQRLFVHAKYKGKFHHSSFLQGGAVLSAGGIVVEDGRILKLTADSGHYRWVKNLDVLLWVVDLCVGGGLLAADSTGGVWLGACIVMCIVVGLETEDGRIMKPMADSGHYRWVGSCRTIPAPCQMSTVLRTYVQCQDCVYTHRWTASSSQYKCGVDGPSSCMRGMSSTFATCGGAVCSLFEGNCQALVVYVH
jgi:hypothetical protein